MEILGLGILSLIFLGLTTWMAWRIMEKAGFPGYVGLFNVTPIIPGIGTLLWVILLWVFAFIDWPRDAGKTPRVAYQPPGGPMPPQPQGPLAPQGPLSLPPGPPQPQALPAPPPRLAAPAAAVWTLMGTQPGGGPLRFDIDESRQSLIVGSPSAPADLTIIEPSVGAPHARLHILPGRLGLEDLGSPGGTWIDGAQLHPADGIREITNSRQVRFGTVDLTLSRA